MTSTLKHLDMSHLPNIVFGMANPYLRPPQPDHHIWSVATDPIKRQVFQRCSCGWKTKVRDFYGAACTYDTAYQWMNHFDVKSGD
jgi:hypothetical protein